ncbi:hypothetical protein ACFXJ5_25635 [Streptomyces sp. NPDC059373]
MGSGDSMRWEVELLGHVDGTREDALRELENRALRFKPAKPFSVRRSRLYRTGDGFLQANEGMTTTYHCRFSMAEMVRDSKDPSVAARFSGPKDRVPDGS